MRSFLIICFLSFFFISCYHPSPSESMEDLKSIEGKWTSYKGIVLKENWRFENENLIAGEGYSMNGNDTSFFESLEIFKEKDSIYYSVMFGNEESIDFLLKDASRDSWTFVNTENDFPSIIKYELHSDTLLHVIISNIRDNKKQYFYLKRRN